MLCALAAPLCTARAQTPVNGDFETGDLTGWTQFTTDSGSLGTGYPKVAQYDAANSGTASYAAEFQVGLIPGDTGTAEGGGIFQDFTFPAGDFTLSLNVASQGVGFANTDAGTFKLLFDGNVVSSITMGTLAAFGQKYATLTGSVSGVSAGQHELGIQITRGATTSSHAPVEYLDNVQVSAGAAVPEPSSSALLAVGLSAGAGAMELMRRKRKSA